MSSRSPNKARASISAITSSFRPRRSSQASPRYVRDYGAPSFKIFMNNRGGEGARLGLPDIDDGFLFRLCEAAAENGGMVCPHPETIEIAWVLRDRLKASDPEGHGGLKTWNATRPPFVEADAVQRAAYVAHTAGAPLYVVHTSSAEALEAALRHRRAGATVHIETCPHYLTHDVGWPGGDIGKINPPLREAADREALWQGLRDGEIDTVATDHVHRDISAKAGGIWTASPGCPGLETLLPVLLSEGHHKRGLPLERIVEVAATNPARDHGSRPRQGQHRARARRRPGARRSGGRMDACSAATWCRAPAIRSMKASVSRVVFVTPSCVAAPFCATTRSSTPPSATAATSGGACRPELSRAQRRAQWRRRAMDCRCPDGFSTAQRR